LLFAGQDGFRAYLQIKFRKSFIKDSISGDNRWQGASAYSSDNSLNVNFNADNGLNINNWNRSNQNWNLGALPWKSPSLSQ